MLDGAKRIRMRGAERVKATWAMASLRALASSSVGFVIGVGAIWVTMIRSEATHVMASGGFLILMSALGALPGAALHGWLGRRLLRPGDYAILPGLVISFAAWWAACALGFMLTADSGTASLAGMWSLARFSALAGVYFGVPTAAVLWLWLREKG